MSVAASRIYTLWEWTCGSNCSSACNHALEKLTGKNRAIAAASSACVADSLHELPSETLPDTAMSEPELAKKVSELSAFRCVHASHIARSRRESQGTVSHAFAFTPGLQREGVQR